MSFLGKWSTAFNCYLFSQKSSVVDVRLGGKYAGENSNKSGGHRYAFALAMYLESYIYLLIFSCFFFFFVDYFFKAVDVQKYCKHLHLQWDLIFVNNTSRVFHVKTTWKRSFPRRFIVEYTWCVCRDSAMELSVVLILRV